VHKDGLTSNSSSRYFHEMERADLTRTVHVVEYMADWPHLFSRLREEIWSSVSDLAVGIEHIGSTSVPGLAAKPIIDIDLIVESKDIVPLAVTRLTMAGYVHQGDLGIADREALDHRSAAIAHNLYLCPRDSLALRNHIAFRDYLRTHASSLASYSSLKKRLAAEFPRDIARYVEGKREFILRVLGECGFSADCLDSMHSTNKRLQTPTQRAKPIGH
jgi:GrpB-like predicted nucleotidyltransferase (UPF0157 family)